MMIEQLKIIRWLLGSRYQKILSDTLSQSAKEVRGVVDITKSYFPFFNQGYFKGFSGLKDDVQNIVDIHVNEVDLPKGVFGAYLAKSIKNKETIFINKGLPQVFKLSTLAHEVSHSAVWRYYQKQDHTLQLTPVRYRLRDFKEGLSDKQELLADVVTAIGTYPYEDFRKHFIAKKKPNQICILNLADYLRAFIHLRGHYPDVSKNFFFRKGVLLNLALIVHFLRLRFFVYKTFDV